DVLGRPRRLAPCRRRLLARLHVVEKQLGETCPASVDAAVITALDAASQSVQAALGPGSPSSQHFVVAIGLDRSVAGIGLRLGYPAQLDLPGAGESVANRVALAFPSGLSVAYDADDVGNDAREDTLLLSYVTLVDQPAGRFATVTF